MNDDGIIHASGNFTRLVAALIIVALILIGVAVGLSVLADTALAVRDSKGNIVTTGTTTGTAIERLWQIASGIMGGIVG